MVMPSLMGEHCYSFMGADVFLSMTMIVARTV